MKHLITGGAGFIGTNYIRYILGKYPGDSIVCVDKLTTPEITTTYRSL